MIFDFLKKNKKVEIPLELKLNGLMIHNYIQDVIRHTCLVELYLDNYESKDTEQRPHDLVGEGNKLQWDVLSGLSIKYHPQYNEEMHFQKYVAPAIEINKQQDHHKIWEDAIFNEPSDLMKRSMIDTICTILEKNDYSFTQVEKEIETQTPYKKEWMNKFISKTKFWKIPEYVKPGIFGIQPFELHYQGTNRLNGLTSDVKAKIKSRTTEALTEAINKGYTAMLY